MPFPTSRVTPTEDPTERCMHTLIDVVRDFSHAIAAADSVDRAIQLRQRLGACIELLTDVEKAAGRKMDSL